VQIFYNEEKDLKMTYKPMQKNKFLEYLRIVGWTIRKGSIDWNIYNQEGHFICAVIISHGKNTKSNEITARSVQKIKKAFEERGLEWPPKKKKK
jgi:hypothetical protein